ncbi:MAG TPA: hypothetical protein VIP52_00340 [Candidatus Dormibacteraeota bacterium]
MAVRSASTRRLRELGSRVAELEIARTAPRAVLLTGSAAIGESDYQSDLDLILYHDELPSDATLAACRDELGGTDFVELGRAEGEYGEQVKVDGIDCQLGHSTVAAWERDMAAVLDQLEVDTPIQKALGGLLEGIVLHDPDGLLAGWRARASAYPERLRIAMVEANLAIPATWYIADRLRPRDAKLWLHEELVDAAYQVLGVLAGLNRVYFSRFQFKRLRRFADSLAVAPPDIADRLDLFFTGDDDLAVATLEELVPELRELVRVHLPAALIPSLRRPPGSRHQPWGGRAGG